MFWNVVWICWHSTLTGGTCETSDGFCRSDNRSSGGWRPNYIKRKRNCSSRRWNWTKCGAVCNVSTSDFCTQKTSWTLPGKDSFKRRLASNKRRPDELNISKNNKFPAEKYRQRLMQELQTTRGLLMRCWTRVRDLEQQQDMAGNMLEGSWHDDDGSSNATSANLPFVRSRSASLQTDDVAIFHCYRVAQSRVSGFY